NPQPIAIPISGFGASPAASFASWIASKKALRPKPEDRERSLVSFTGSVGCSSKSLTSAAILVSILEASNNVIVSVPDFPASILRHVCSVLRPSGVTQPNPVTTTLFFIAPPPMTAHETYALYALHPPAQQSKLENTSYSSSSLPLHHLQHHAQKKPPHFHAANLHARIAQAHLQG